VLHVPFPDTGWTVDAASGVNVCVCLRGRESGREGREGGGGREGGREGGRNAQVERGLQRVA
jgi:hypothetical protein